MKVDNKPPRIIVSHVPAVLIPIDGKPVIHTVTGTWFERVVNSQALIIRELGHKTLFLHLYDGWMTAETLNGPWTRTSALPPAQTSWPRISPSPARSTFSTAAPPSRRSTTACLWSM